MNRLVAPILFLGTVIVLWNLDCKLLALLVAVVVAFCRGSWINGYGISLQWNKDVESCLIKICRITENFNRVEVIRRALAVYHVCVMAHAEGKTVTIDDKELEIK